MRAKERLLSKSITSIEQVYRDYQKIEKDEQFEFFVQDSLLCENKMQ